MASILKVDKLDPQSGTALEIGTSGDTVTVPSGATLDISSATLTPPATLPASSGVNLTALNASNLGSGTVPTGRLGSGTASSSTVLYGDQTYKAEPGLGSGNINNVFRFSVTDGGMYTNNSATNTVSFDAISWSATSGRIYLINSVVSTRPAKTADNTAYRLQEMHAYYGTTDRSQGDTTVDTRLASNDFDGVVLDAASTGLSYGYHSYPVLGSFTAGSTATHYFYVTQAHAYAGTNSRCYSAADIAPWTTVIYEILP